MKPGTSSLVLERCRPLQRQPRYFSRAALRQAFGNQCVDPCAPTTVSRSFKALLTYLVFPMALPHFSPPEERPLSRTQSKALANNLRLTNPLHTHANSSSYTLRTIPTNDHDFPTTTTDPLAPWQTDPSRGYGATPGSPSFWARSPGMPSFRRPLLMNAAIKMAVLFIVSCLVLGGTLWIALPTLEEYVYFSLHDAANTFIQSRPPPSPHS